METLKIGQKLTVTFQLILYGGKEIDASVKITLHSCQFSEEKWWAVLSVEFSTEIHLHGEFQHWKYDPHENAVPEPPAGNRAGPGFSILSASYPRHTHTGVHFNDASEGGSRTTLFSITIINEHEVYKVIRFTEINEKGVDYTFEPEEVIVSRS